MSEEIFVRKITGGKEKFKPEKIKNTCQRAGASPKLAEKIALQISKEVYNGIPTKEILKKIHLYLKKFSPVLSDLYSLKSAMLQLGPGGFIFEEYCTRLLNHYQIYAFNPQPVLGLCIDHEIDIIFENKNSHLDIFKQGEIKNKGYSFVECKYHNKAGIYSGSKDILYTWARFLDLKEGFKNKKNPYNFTLAWLITNTKFSGHAKRFALCKEMNILGWNWPKKKNLAYYIEKAKFWPITILTELDQQSRNALFEERIILVKDLIQPDFKLRKKKIPSQKLIALQKEAKKIMEFQKS